MKFSKHCKYCKFKVGCENIKRDSVEDCCIYREADYVENDGAED